MTNPTEHFFSELSRRGHEPLLRRASGTVRFDLDDGGRVEHWLVDIRHGDVSVSRRAIPADCLLHMSRAYFDRMVTGEVNGLATILRNAGSFEGDPSLLVLLQRIFPGQSGEARR